MADLKHVLFVCTGNTCRSPMAEGLFRKALGNRTDYQVSSAGIAASRDTPSSRETAELLKKHKAPLDAFASRPVTETILAQATHVFAMTRGHLATLEAQFPAHLDKFYLVGEFSTHDPHASVRDVPDPIGMGRQAYEEVAQVFQIAIPAIIAYIDSTTEK